MEQRPVNDPNDEFEVLAAFETAYEMAARRADLLREWQGRYPQHRELLTDAAVLYSLAEHAELNPEEDAWGQAAWEKAVAERRAAYQASQPDAPMLNLAKELKARGGIPQAARALRVSVELLQMLGQGMVRLADAPVRFLDLLAERMEQTRRELVIGLPGGPLLAARMHYQSAQAPQVTEEQISFEQALLEADLDPEDLRFWLSEIEAGRTLGAGGGR